jgi:hypothetical protein
MTKLKIERQCIGKRSYVGMLSRSSHRHLAAAHLYDAGEWPYAAQAP